MILETYNYLLTREQVIKLSTNDLINQTKKNNDFIDKLKMIRHIMNNENIFLLSDCDSSIQNWLQEFRFTYNKDPEINRLMNEVISITQVYKGLSITEKTSYIRDWLQLEGLRRNIRGQLLISENEILSYVLEDSKNLKFVLDGLETKCFDGEEVDIDVELLISTFQMLRHQFPEVFEESRELLEATIWLSNEIRRYSKDRKINRLTKDYVKQVSYQMGPYYDEKIKKKEF